MFGKKIQVDPSLVRNLAELLNETGLTEIEVQSGTQRVRVSRGATAIAAAAAPVAAAPAPANRPAAVEASEVNFNNHPGAITSPMVGTAYRSPEPGARPFVDVGDSVKIGQTLLIVEAMKTMNAIPATKAGKVTHVLIDDGQPVEFGQPLVVVE
ncbi:MAG: acetyl-CoA carboxylase biotin carboxyl carrier protein [Xanthobacteraceae bacterium]|nr:acetyl-CoA carboxylase biotin carboxyl carrier protein [Xanthobacteraceae bacterium]MBX3523401.1 acetyl-CoA carboxylase biotin carboxyl carrier protein [Xanthobacteraceae bacterium]MBX3534054.1 acetyl-CoA carboxylase biotin carboxyl carrier protein [Xanthobacteraceae bacterium]MBX3548787.1 acetyl-CoA carboxylase biotin carboxyl carrier protein [Xanthobacteraceae bacterium]MCW5674419.1 acetyl-CoA carboxylase biotin carboxyl carrier protein [Xanthobacteraceae bacterium]